MKKSVFKILSIIISAVLLLSVFSINTFAAATSSVAFSSNEITIGGNLTVTVRFASDKTMYGVLASVEYNPDVLQYTSSDESTQFSRVPGLVKISPESSGKSISMSLTFKAIATGSSTIAVRDITCEDNGVEVAVGECSAVVKVKNASASASSNANLKSLSVSPGTLSPKFSKDVTSYSVTIPNDKTECLVTYALADSKATAKVEGSKTMKVGLNKRTVIVTAENGTTKSYVINITRLDATGTVPDTPAEDPVDQNKIEVFADGETMYIEENFSSELVPEGFVTDVYNYNGTEVPCISAGAVKLFYLIMPDGTGADFYMLLTDGTFTKPQKLNVGGTDYYLFPLPEGEKLPVGYKQIQLTIGEQSVLAYQSEDAELSDFVLVYAMGKNGNPGLYRYDTIDGTIQRILGMGFDFEEEKPVEEEKDEDVLAIIKSLNTNGIIVAVAILAVFLLLIAAIIVLIIKIATAGKERRYKEEELPEEEEDFVPFDYVTVEDREKDE